MKYTCNECVPSYRLETDYSPTRCIDTQEQWDWAEWKEVKDINMKSGVTLIPTNWDINKEVKEKVTETIDENLNKYSSIEYEIVNIQFVEDSIHCEIRNKNTNELYVNATLDYCRDWLWDRFIQD